MIDPEISIMIDKTRKEVEQFAIRRHEMMMGHTEMMQSSDQRCKDCAKQIKSGKNDINGIMPMMDQVKNMGINAEQNMNTYMGGG